MAEYEVRTDVADPARVPQMRLRMTEGGGPRSAALVADSRGDGAFSPTPTGHRYRLPFVLEFDQLASQIEFELLNFDATDAFGGNLVLESAGVFVYRSDALTTPLFVRRYDFADGAQGWVTQITEAFAAPEFSASTGALRIQGIAGRSDVFGYWLSPSGDV